MAIYSNLSVTELIKRPVWLWDIDRTLVPTDVAFKEYSDALFNGLLEEEALPREELRLAFEQTTKRLDSILWGRCLDLVTWPRHKIFKLRRQLEVRTGRREGGARLCQAHAVERKHHRYSCHPGSTKQAASGIYIGLAKLHSGQLRHGRAVQILQPRILWSTSPVWRRPTFGSIIV